MLRILCLYLKIAIFQELWEYVPYIKSVAAKVYYLYLKTTIFKPKLPRTKGGIEPATTGLRMQAREPRNNKGRTYINVRSYKSS